MSSLSNETIKRIALYSGFTTKEGGDLRSYVYEFARAIEKTAIDRVKQAPLTQRKIQSVIDSGEYREMKGATVLVNKQGHAAIVNRGGAFYWVDNEALVREWDLAGEGDE